MENLLGLVVAILLCQALCGQQVSIPYKIGNQWGLADTSGHIILAPQYDGLEYTGYYTSSNVSSCYFLAKKNGKTGLLANGRLILQPLYRRILVDSLFAKSIVIGAFKNKQNIPGEVLYNLKGEQLMADTVYELTRIADKAGYGHRLYTISPYLYGHGGVLWYDIKTQKIKQWIVKNIRYASAYYYNKNVYDLYVYDKMNSVVKKYDMAFNTELNKYELVPAHNNRTEPEVRGTSEGGNYNSYTNSDIPVNRNENLLFKRYLFKIYDNQVKLETSTGKYYSQYNNGTSPQNNIVPTDNDGLVLMTYNSDKVPPFRIPINQAADTIYRHANFIKFRKNGKWGIVASDKAIPAIYDSLEYFSNGVIHPLFITGNYIASAKKWKWGVRDALNNEILPTEYDEIIRKPNSNFWLLKKDGKYGLANYKGTLEFNPVYEKITPDDYSYTFQVFDKGKYGFISANAKCYPIMPYRIAAEREFGGYHVFQLVAGDGAPLGYADKKGFLYFK
jgi:hypothetical protein